MKLSINKTGAANSTHIRKAASPSIHYSSKSGWHKFYSRSYKLNRTEMANIDVQKKKSNPALWILLVILILAIVGYFIWRNYNKGAVAGTTATDTTIQTDTITP